MIQTFETAFKYVILDEGGITNNPADHGGLTHYGITAADAKNHRCPLHPNGINIDSVDLSAAHHIYLLDYWPPYDAIAVPKVAIKLFDYAVNYGPGECALLAQRSCVELGMVVSVDGAFGPNTVKAVNGLDANHFLDTLENQSNDRYCDIVVTDFTKAYGKKALQDRQLKFLKGWIRRSNRRYYGQ